MVLGDRLRNAVLLLLLATPLFAFAFLGAAPEHNHQIAVPLHHAVIVVLTAFIAVVLAALILRTALHLRHVPSFLLGLGLLSMAAIFLVHGLSTPGIILGPNPVTGPAARLSFLVCGFFMAAGALSDDAPWAQQIGERMTPVLWSWSAALAVLGVAGMAVPDLFAFVPITSQPLAGVVFAVTLALLAAAAAGFWRRYYETDLPLSGALAVAAALLIQSVAIMFFSETWRLNWWLYHLTMLVGFLVAALAMLWEYSEGRNLRRVVEGMFSLRSLVELELEYTDAISVLAAATEAKDPYTQGHTVRVAELATRVGKAMGLPPVRLRVLARAGLLHDVGKLGVPDAILLKPGPLTHDEFAVIKEHPRQGHDILRRVGRLEEEIKILVCHHERVDGTGYPHGLKGDQIPLEARILSVADVYDALTTNRPYRSALSQAEALEIIGKGSGSHLDSACVDALARVLRPASPPTTAPAPATAL